ncbi:MAG: peptidase M22 [Clostridia bacterium]|nr:peptidase M22 [Clostridia bacterium]
MDKVYVGVDTSNYTTSVAVCDGEGRIIANLKAPLTVKEGMRGLRQSDAVFEHIKNLPSLMQKLEAVLSGRSIEAVGVSVRPRDAEGSYMPCFLSGKSAAYSLAAGASAPVYEFSHQNGHVAAAMYSSGASELARGKFYAFHVSGGTTELLLVSIEDGEMHISLVGETADINGGQLIDRVGVAMGLDFPAGRALETLAAAYVGTPYKHKVCVCDVRCSLSGAENIALKLYSEKGRECAAAFVFDFLGRTLKEMRAEAFEKHGKAPVLYAGGVMSNTLMRDMLSEGCGGEAHFSSPEFSADNAAGIALLCRKKHILLNSDV